MKNKIPLHHFQWNLEMLKIPYEELYAKKCFVPKVALIDSGIDKYHPELIKKINIEDSFDFSGDDSDILDLTGHGTMVAGVICAEEVIKGCFPNVELIVYKISNDNTYRIKNLINAIVKAIESEVQIINLSLSLPFDKMNQSTIDIICKLFEKANSLNIFITIAAGNQNKKIPPNFTNRFNNVYLIGATDRGGLKSSYSNYGAIDFLVPGGDWRQVEFSLDDPIVTCFPTYLHTMDQLNNNIGISKGYCIGYGTSIATAHCTGIIAFLISDYFDKFKRILKPNELYSILIKLSRLDKSEDSIHGELSFRNAHINNLWRNIF